MEGERDTFYLEQVTITEGSEDGYQYEEIPADDDFSLAEGEEDLLRAVRTVEEQAEDLQAQRSPTSSQRAATHRPEVVDDFLRNFLIKMGMMKTLECFQTEWYEMMKKGLLQPEAVGFVPDVYAHNQMLDTEIRNLKKEVETYKLAASKAKEAMIKLQKERDFHRMHHKRVAQEKNKLINDIKRLKAHYASYEPLLRQLHEKYQTVLRQKMLTSLERDRALGEGNSLQPKNPLRDYFQKTMATSTSLVTGLQATIRNSEYGQKLHLKKEDIKYKRAEGLTQKALREAREKELLQEGVALYNQEKDPNKLVGKRHLKVASPLF